MNITIKQNCDFTWPNFATNYLYMCLIGKFRHQRHFRIVFFLYDLVKKVYTNYIRNSKISSSTYLSIAEKTYFFLSYQ